MAELFFNDPGTTLAALCNVGDTTITVSTYSGYPATGNFRIKIDSEIMLVTSVSTVTWTVTRAMESTTATSHSNGAAVNHVFSGGSITQGFTDAASTTATAISVASATAANLSTYLAYFNVDAQETTASTSYVSLATPESITFMTTATHTLLIEYKYGIFNAGTYYTPFNEIKLDGTVILDAACASEFNNTVGGMPLFCFNYAIAAGVTAGSHTIAVRHRVDGGSGFRWNARLLTVAIV